MDATSSSQFQCPLCGKPLPEDAVKGCCPQCLMAGAMQPTQHGEQAAPLPILTPAELAPHFPQLEILECLGRGGMGVVYKVRQKSLNRFVALKLLAPERADDPQFAARFEKEALALAALNHPHIVGVYDFGRAGGFYFLLMEFVDGVNLRQLMQTRKLTPKEALSIVPPVCEALQCAHDCGIVHRDIKPENLMIDKARVVKIADFGIAKILGARLSEVAEAVASSFADPHSQPLGTPDYAAPEQRDNTGATDHRADIYSLGVVLYEMLTGERPKDKIEAPSRRVQVDIRIDEIVLRALEKAPELRYQTAGEFRTQLENLTEAPDAAPAVPSASPRLSRSAAWSAAWITLSVFVMPPFIWHEVKAHEFENHGPFATPLMALVFFLFLVPAFTAPMGATLLGWIGVTQIRRSAGKLYGLGLAVFDGLLFPLLVLDALLWAVSANALILFSNWQAHAISEHVRQSASDPLGTFDLINRLGAHLWLQTVEWNLFRLVMLVLVILVDWLIIRAVWRRVGRSPAAPSTVTSAQSANTPLAYVAMFFGCLAGVLGVVTFCSWPAPSQFLVWSILASALLGIVLGIPAHGCRLGRKAMLVGVMQTAVWFIIAAFGPRVPSGTWAFGHTTECVLTDAMNLETGTMTLLPLRHPLSENAPQRYAWFNGPPDPFPWMHEHGIDLIDLGNHGLAAIDMFLLELEPRDWEGISSAQLKGKLISYFGNFEKPVPYDLLRNPQGTYGFRTRQGSFGILECLSTNVPLGVKIRYRLVPDGTKTVAAAPATLSSSFGPPITTSLQGTMKDDELKKLSWHQFDQTEHQYWRELADVRRYRDAAQLIEHYLSLHPELAEGTAQINGANLHFHAAQCWAMAGETAAALKHLPAAHQSTPDTGGLLWNDYVAGTEAFLKGDRPALLSAHEKLAYGDPLNKPNLAVLDRLLAGFGKPYGDAYHTDGQDHKKLSADCFNQVWELLEKKNRTAEENERMISLAHASLAHWRMRNDCKDQNLSVGYWQISRVYAALGQGENAKRYGQLCLSVSAKEPPFYRAYAHEALARAALLLKDRASFDEHSSAATQLTPQVTDPDERKLLEDDLKALLWK